MSYALIFKAPILSLVSINIRETTNIWVLSLNLIYKIKGKVPEIGSEGKKKKKKNATTLRTLAKTPTFIFENTQFFPECFHYVEG